MFDVTLEFQADEFAIRGVDQQLAAMHGPKRMLLAQSNGIGRVGTALPDAAHVLVSQPLTTVCQ